MSRRHAAGSSAAGGHDNKNRRRDIGIVAVLALEQQAGAAEPRESIGQAVA
jgi:hypothetical protein